MTLHKESGLLKFNIYRMNICYTFSRNVFNISTISVTFIGWLLVLPKMCLFVFWKSVGVLCFLGYLVHILLVFFQSWDFRFSPQCSLGLCALLRCYAAYVGACLLTFGAAHQWDLLHLGCFTLEHGIDWLSQNATKQVLT